MCGIHLWEKAFRGMLPQAQSISHSPACLET